MTAATIKQCQERSCSRVHTIIRTVRRFVLIVVFGFAVSAAPAPAATCQAPPGTSAIDQYCEVVPDGAGGSSTGGGSGPNTPGLSRGSEAALSRHGADGQGVVALAESTARSSAGSASAGSQKQSRRGKTPQSLLSERKHASSVESRNGVLQAAASSASQEASRAGGAFIVVLLAAIVAMVGWGWMRFRQT
jgi:cobalamin biosynthesis Mg chelatase CobN